RGFLAALTLMAAYGLAQAAVCGRLGSTPTGWLGRICLHPYRVRGPYSIYMTFGAVLMLGILLCLAQLAEGSWAHARWLIPTAGLMITALALTYARNAWLGLAAGVLGLVAMLRRAWPVVVILGGLLVGAAAAGPAAVQDRIRSLADPHDATLRDRVAMWRSGWAMVRDHPGLGVGPGQVRAWYPSYRRPEAVR